MRLFLLTFLAMQCSAGELPKGMSDEQLSVTALPGFRAAALETSIRGNSAPHRSEVGTPFQGGATRSRSAMGGSATEARPSGHDAASIADAAIPERTPALALTDPICPSRIWIAQEYIDRKADGTITGRVWIRRCTATKTVRSTVPRTGVVADSTAKCDKKGVCR